MHAFFRHLITLNFLTIFLLSFGNVPAWAHSEKLEKPKIFSIGLQAGFFIPDHIEVKAYERFSIDLENKNDWPAEFESAVLHIEKLVAPKSHITVKFRGLEKGIYEFVDDFQPGSHTFTIVVI